MKKIYLLTTLLIASIIGTNAQSDPLVGGVIPSSKLPSCTDFINANPYPTRETDPEAWENDSILYFQLKEPRYDTLQIGDETIVQQNYDSIWADLNEQYYFALHRLGADSVMDASFITINWGNSIQLTDEKTGENKTYYRSVSSHPRNTTTFPSMNALEQLCEEVKTTNTPGSQRVRPRPFNYFPNQYYNGSLKDHDPDGTGSYPSGHGYFRGIFGRCLEIVDPEHNEAIQDMLDEWLHCRLQKGAHWYSDLPAGQKLGEMAFDSAMTVEAFRELLFATRSELREHRKERGAYTEVSDSENSIEAQLQTALNTTTNFTLDRTFYKDGYFNTLCLPFSLSSLTGTPLDGGELFAFESANNNGGELELNVQPANSIEAGKPYLIRWENGNNIYSMTFANVIITAYQGQVVGSEGVQFVGTLGQSQLTEGNTNQLFLGAQNSLYWPNTSNNLKGFRAYFLVSGQVAPNNTPARFVIRNTPTSTERVANPSIKARKILKNGRLLILHNGATYDAQGQIVK